MRERPMCLKTQFGLPSELLLPEANEHFSSDFLSQGQKTHLV